MLLFLTAIAIALIAGACAARQSAAPSLDLHVNPATQRLYDSQGRERIFHGTNVVYKLPPYVPALTGEFDAQFSLVDADFQLMADMGFNSIRVNVPWAAAEPTISGGFNESWFAEVEQLISSAANYGIYTFMDMHQDAMSVRFCGTGFPDWAMQPTEENFPVPLKKSPVPIDPSLGYPNRTVCDSINNNNFIDYYFAESVSTATGALYNNTHGIRDRFANFWGYVALRLGAKIPSIVGFELLNEPWAGDIYANPALLLPGVADRIWLQPLYDQLATSIRAHVPNALIMFQSVTWEVIDAAEKLGFEHVPGGALFQNRSVLAFHNSVTPKFAPDEKYYAMKIAEAKRLGCALWVTETGSAQLDLLDAVGISWNMWDYKWFANKTWDNSCLWETSADGYDICADRHNLTACFLPAVGAEYARTFPQAVAGRTLSFSFNSTTGAAVLTFEAAPLPFPQSDIFVSERFYYPRGYTVTGTPQDALSFNTSVRNLLSVTFLKSQPENVTITILPS